MITFASFNLCGLHKLYRHQRELAQLRECDIVFVQESLQTQPTRLFPGFTVFDHFAVLTASRPSGGLSILLKREKFGATSLTVEASDQHLLAV